MLAEVTDSDYQGEIGLLLHNGGMEEYVWNAGDDLLLLPCSVINSVENYSYNNLNLMAQTFQK